MKRTSLALCICIAACSSTTAQTESTTPRGEARAARAQRARHVRAAAATETADAAEEDDDAVTAQDQSSTEHDVEITRLVRENVMGDDDLSFTSKNCMIVTQNAVVTLRGSVPSQAERSAIEADVHRVEGVRRIDNQLEVSP